MDELTKGDRTELKRLDKTIEKLSVVYDTLSEGRKSFDISIKTLRKQREMLQSEIDKVYNELSSCQDKFRSIEKGKTCFGCHESCSVSRDKFSLRCDRYNDLPF
ncbi:hypothetical protein [Bacteroides sp.]|uniref:hypothetical protein n=1 Tax=Bacteroides sp. TaxID=29523 RepID=UPI002608D61B|nr:hypothetical protein [Bacteroides sp.]MDD3040356.1 hypothetical protein [Bacteroides sp.]